MTTPNLSMLELVTNQQNPENIYNDNLATVDTLLQLVVIDTTLTAPPGSPTDGDRYIPAATATGAWAGHENEIAYYYGGWYFFTPELGWTTYNLDSGSYLSWSGSAWIATQMDPLVLDTTFRVLKSTDATSRMIFDMTKVATSTDTTFIMPNGDVEFAKTKLDATAAPTVNNDIDEDYEPGSIWVDQTNDLAYLCVDNADGAAIWRQMAGATGTGDVNTTGTVTDNAITRYHTTTGDDIQASTVYIDDNDALYGNKALLLAKTAAYTLTGADSGKLIVCNSASAFTLTLPQTSTESIAVGVQYAILNRGAGVITIAIEGSDTLESKSSYVNIGQYSAASVVKVVAGSPNTWALFGDIQ